MPVNRTEFDPLIGRLLSERYLVEQNLAASGSDSGGMGIVYLARDQKLLGKKVVIKLLRGESLADPDLRRKFEHEKEALIRLDHPGVVRILDHGFSIKGEAFIVMDYVPGYSLRKLLNNGPVEPSLVGDLVLSITEALATAHENNILHRDIKPENIMVTPRQDGQFSVTLIDFGIARVSESKLAPITDTFRPIGTVLYMSPEQLLGSQDVSPAVDIYALGIVIFEMLTGKKPFLPKSAADMYKLESDGIDVGSLDIGGVSSSAKELIAAALSFSPADRPRDVKEFGRELHRILSTDQTLSNSSDLGKVFVTPEYPGSEDSEINTVASSSRGSKKFSSLKLALSLSLLITIIVVSFLMMRPSGSSREQTRNSSTNFQNRAIGSANKDISSSAASNSGSLETAELPSSETSDSAKDEPAKEADSGGSSPVNQTEVPSDIGPVNSPFGIDLELNRPDPSDGSSVTTRVGTNTVLRSGDKFRMLLASTANGYIYVFNEGEDVTGKKGFRLLFPTQNVNRNSPRLSAGKEIRTAINRVDNNPGIEIIWAIWSPTPLNDLDEIWRTHPDKRNAVSQTHASVLSSYLQFVSSSGEIDPGAGPLILPGQNSILIHRYLLEHR